MHHPSILGSRLKKLRLERGMSQAQLAIASSVQRVTITNLESGYRKDATTETARRLAFGLRVSLDTLIGYAPPRGCPNP